MTYSNTNIDKKNFKWFKNDNTRQSLSQISLVEGRMRGLEKFSLEFDYPITAISGANGSGKSTILALAACAFHNFSKPKGFCLPGRKHTYHTFSDFFMQSAGEIGPDGVEIKYKIRHNNWRRKRPEGEGSQTRRKRKGGKWNNYDTRVSRNVIYFGVQRVVPYYERSTHKSYRAYFKAGKLAPEIRERIATLAGKILGKKYKGYDRLEHTKYWLPKVETDKFDYSGFNMGAGESAVLEILSTLFDVGPGCLLVIDEIELGLHERAQERFIKELKIICSELKCQIICTTHSFEILSSLPPEGRVYLDSIAGSTQVFKGISAEFACGKMGRSGASELDIFVEDQVAQAIVESSLDQALRTRCNILEIGSHGSLKRLMASRFMEKRINCLCLLDGDQRGAFEETKVEIANNCDGKFSAQSEAIQVWVGTNLDYMPGEDWPEKWIFEQAIDCFDGWQELAVKFWAVDSAEKLKELLEEAIAAGKHEEFRTLSAALALQEENVRSQLITMLRTTIPASFDQISDKVESLLK